MKIQRLCDCSGRLHQMKMNNLNYNRISSICDPSHAFINFIGTIQFTQHCHSDTLCNCNMYLHPHTLHKNKEEKVTKDYSGECI